MSEDLHDPLYEDVMKILFAGALDNGVKEISWEDAPKVMAALQRSGLVVRGEYLTEDYTRLKNPVISVEFKLRIRGILAR